MLEKIKGFFKGLYTDIKGYFCPRPFPSFMYEPMNDEDWAHFRDEVQRVFEAVKPYIRRYIDTAHTAPSMDEIQKMAEQEMQSIRWHYTFNDIVNCNKLHGLENVWKHMQEQLEPYTSEYIKEYIKETKRREIMSVSVCSIIKSQLDQKGLEYQITPQKLRLKLEIKREGQAFSYVIPYAGFMKNPDIDNYLKKNQL